MVNFGGKFQITIKLSFYTKIAYYSFSMQSLKALQYNCNFVVIVYFSEQKKMKTKCIKQVNQAK